MTRENQSCAAIGELLTGYLDNELTQQSSQRVRLHLESCSTCRKLHQDLAAVQMQMRQLSYPKDDEALLDAIENDFAARASAGLGWVLLLSGLAIIAGAALFGFFNSPDVPGFVRLFYALFMLGGIALFGSVLRQRLLGYKHDRYRKVKL